MSFTKSLKNIIFRGLIYQFALFLAVNQLVFNNQSEKFKDRIIENISKFPYKHHYIDVVYTFITTTPLFPTIYKGCMIALIAFSIFATLFNCAFSKFIVANLFFIFSIVNFSPLLTENKIRSNNKYGVRNELFMMVGVSIGMYMMIFKRCCSCKKEKKEEEEKQEIEMTQVKTNKNKNKKKH